MSRLLLFSVVFFALVMGCKQETSNQVTMATVSSEPFEPSQVELTEPKITLEAPDLVKFEMKYKFIKGKPTGSYLCELTFPGTTNIGRKFIENWQLKESGDIKDSIHLQSMDPFPAKYSIRFAEAEVPDRGFDTISNIITGELTPP